MFARGQHRDRFMHYPARFGRELYFFSSESKHITSNTLLSRTDSLSKTFFTRFYSSMVRDCFYKRIFRIAEREM